MQIPPSHYVSAESKLYLEHLTRSIKELEAGRAVFVRFLIQVHGIGPNDYIDLESGAIYRDVGNASESSPPLPDQENLLGEELLSSIDLESSLELTDPTSVSAWELPTESESPAPYP